MTTALPLTDYISQSTSRTRKYRGLSAQFGDGYTQDAPDGINATWDEYNVVYMNLNTTNRDTLIAALDSVGSWDVLTWTPPGASSSLKWKVTKEGINETAQAGGTFSVQFRLKQVF